eukprot:11206947-Lingulodinium_polyedra.AAC.1
MACRPAEGSTRFKANVEALAREFVRVSSVIYKSVAALAGQMQETHLLVWGKNYRHGQTAAKA